MRTILIGNGSSLLWRTLGREIDAYDQVVRINRCYIEGYENYVGTRTDIWVVSLHGALKHFTWPNVMPQPRTILCYPYSSHADIMEKHKSKIDPSIEFMSLDTAKAIFEFTGGYYCSTGLTAAFMFRPCDIVGFDHFSGAKNHYGDDLTDPHSHSIEKEKQFFAAMEQLGYIRRL